jgi:HEAT repeat protein
MTTPPDERTIPEVVAAALAGDEDDQDAWEAIRSLHLRGDAPTFDAAVELMRSPSEKRRGRGVDILAQLGTPTQSPELRAKCADAIIGLLVGEQSPAVLHSIGVALGHLGDPRAVSALLPFKDHPDSGVRFGVVLGLSSHSDPSAIDGLIQLSNDLDDDVRNWATFGLGSMTSVDTPALRQALVARLGDSNDEIRGEALDGLAQRKDQRVLEPLRRELTGRRVGVLAVDAAMSLGDPSLLPLLLELQLAASHESADEYFKSVLNEAIGALEKTT